MLDPHQNIFYTYNRDSQLIENNLTRAFIEGQDTRQAIQGEVVDRVRAIPH